MSLQLMNRMACQMKVKVWGRSSILYDMVVWAKRPVLLLTVMARVWSFSSMTHNTVMALPKIRPNPNAFLLLSNLHLQ